jgi:hypothetical protein
VEGTEVVGESAECVNGNFDNLRKGECTTYEYGMHLDFEDMGGNCRIKYVAELDNGEYNGIKGINLDFCHLLNDGMDITEEFLISVTMETILYNLVSNLNKGV